VRVPEDWTPDQAKAFALADNRTAELATWDEQVLATQVLELSEAGFAVAEFGFEAIEPELTEPEVQEDATPEPPTEPISKLGDIWKLGNHRLVCGDSFDKATVQKAIHNTKVNLVFTDPPYGMDLDTDYSNMGATTTTYKKIQNDNAKFDASRLFDLVSCKNWYLWGADYYPETIPQWDKGSMIVWAKAHSEEENKVFGSSFEVCWRLPKAKKEVWFVRRIQMTDELLKAHPTQKPLALGLRAIEKDTKEGDMVFDFFLGSGSTLIAAEKLGRKCHGIELEPSYCDVIIKRWENLTGQKAELVN
jgi:DNA modification methylase